MVSLIAVAWAAETAAAPASPVAAVVGSFGLNLKLFLAQLLNFGLLVIILWRLLYRPLVSFLEERSKRIAEGLENATRYDAKLKALEAERRAVLAKGESEAERLLAAAGSEATQIVAAAKAETERVVAELKARAAREIEQEKRQMLVEVRAGAAELVVLAAEKVIRERIGEAKDQALVREALKEVKL